MIHSRFLAPEQHLWPDPQRLILGIPWYLTAALAFGKLAVPLAWLYLAASTCQGLIKNSWRKSEALSRLLLTTSLAFYIPFALYWKLISFNAL